jgi:DNA repair protein RadA/Sms
MSPRSRDTFEGSLPSEDLSFAMGGGILFSEHAQRAVLGATLMDNSLMYGPLATLCLDDLVGSREQIVYALMLELSAEDERFNLSTFVQILEDRGQLEKAGGAPYVASLIDGAVSEPSLVKRHVESIQRKAQLRRLQAVGEQLMRRACETGADPGRMMLELSKTITELQTGRDLNGDFLPYEPADLSRHAEILTLSQVEARDVGWLWRPYLPNQMLAMLSGDPGAGKTYVALAICAAVTLGYEPNTGAPSSAADVLCLSVENSPEYVLRPRFDKLGGDASRFHILRGSVAGEGKLAVRGSVTLSDISLLRDALTRTKARLVIVDPIQSYLGADVDAHRSNETRPVLDGLARLAEEHKCCILLVRHLGKAQTARAIHRGLGSIDLTGAVRTELIAGSAPNDATQRALVQVKSNLGQFGASIGYTIAADGTFRWTGESQLTASAILAPELHGENPGPLAEAKDFLSNILTRSPRSANDVHAEAHQRGLSDRTLKRAKAELGVVSRKQTMYGVWEWSLPEGGQ